MPRRLCLLALTLSLGCTTTSAPPDILLVTIDTLRADRVGCYGYAEASTPVLDQLAMEGARFAQCQSVAPITLVSHASMLTGLWPHRHGVRNNGTYRLASTIPSLSEKLQAAGYATGAFVAAMPLARRFGLARGFDAYDDDLPRDAGVHMPERPAAEVNRRLLTWLRAADATTPIFAWAHYFEPHHPYQPDPSRPGMDPYDGEVANADAALGELLEGWAASRDRPRVILVTSDHGEGLGDHDEDSHTLLVYQTTQHVPLLLHGEGIEPQVVEEPVSLVDVAPTLLEVAGAPPLTADGVSLLQPPPDARTLYSETLYPLEVYGWSPAFASRRGNRKVIRSATSRAFDLSNDPGELDDRVDAEWASMQLEALDVTIQEARPIATDTRDVSAREMEALGALGYVSGAPASSQTDWLAEIASRPDVTRRMQEFRDLTRAENLLGEKDHTGALSILTAMTQQNPESFWGHFRSGEAWAVQAEPLKALSSFRTAAALRPTWSATHLEIARLERESKNLVEAIAAYRAALALHPDDGRDWLEFVGALQEAGESTKIELPELPARESRLIRDAQTRESPDPQTRARVARARYWASKGIWDRALSELDPVTDEVAEVSWHRAFAAFLRGSLEASLAHLRRTLTLDPNYHEAHNLLAWALITRTSQTETGIEHAREAIRLFPDEPEYHDTLVEGFLRSQRRDLARAHLESLPAHLRAKEVLAQRLRSMASP